MARKNYLILTLALICLLGLSMLAITKALDVDPSDVTLGVQIGDTQTYEFTFTYATFQVLNVSLDIDADNNTDWVFLVKSGEKVTVNVTDITSQGVEYLWTYKFDNGSEITSDTLSREWERLASAYPVLLEYPETGTASWFITLNKTLIEKYQAEGIFDSIEFTETTIKIKASRLLVGVIATVENVYDLNTGWLVNATVEYALQGSPDEIYGEVKLAQYTPPATTEPATSSTVTPTETSDVSSSPSTSSDEETGEITSGFSFVVMISMVVLAGIIRRKKE